VDTVKQQPFATTSGKQKLCSGNEPFNLSFSKSVLELKTLPFISGVFLIADFRPNFK
jgi:hypothetical protein